MSFASLSLTSVLTYGVVAGASGLIDEGRHRECCGKCNRVYIFILVFEGGKRFRAIGLASV